MWKAMYTKRMLKLADFLDELPRQKFDFRVIFTQGTKPPLEALRAGAHRCGTVGCAIGWMPAVFPRDVKWSSWADRDVAQGVCLRSAAQEIDFEAAAVFFGLDIKESEYLFSPNGSMMKSDEIIEHRIGGAATPKQVAAHIRRFVAQKQAEAAL